MTHEKYLKPSVIRTIKRLDLRAQFIIRGFMHGLHSSPLHGFSVEFSEHRKYAQGDDPNDIDWLVYAKTEKYYVRKYESETNLFGYLVVDTSRSMGYTYRQEMTKFEYSICVAAALAYLMVHQQDPVGLITFDKRIVNSIKPKASRKQLGEILSVLSNLTPTSETDISASVVQLSAMLRRQSLVMIFSDLLGDIDSILWSLHRLRHSGHDVILFHILDEAEAKFPFHGQVDFFDPESGENINANADEIRADYIKSINDFRNRIQNDCAKSRIDYVQLDTSIQFDKALIEYLTRRSGRR
ncbi:MAG: DUF58 domain-containing protein [Planctomycetaceae bacterium]|jgi:uncharacterized protein (DUF58 family)|nr:DUF58 domain-containing protein [Planctomycetaceae bacterium]